MQALAEQPILQRGRELSGIFRFIGPRGFGTANNAAKTWMHPATKEYYLIDHVLTNAFTFSLTTHCGIALRSLNADSEHRAVQIVLRLQNLRKKSHQASTAMGCTTSQRPGHCNCLHGPCTANLDQEPIGGGGTQPSTEPVRAGGLDGSAAAEERDNYHWDTHMNDRNHASGAQHPGCE